MEPQDNQFRSEDVLAEIKRSLNSRKIVDVEEEQVKIVIFKVGGQDYALYGSNVLEILSGRETYPVPFLPDHIPGLINVRGEIEAAIDICRFLGGQSTAPGKGMIIMIQHESFRSGLVVDCVEDVFDVPIGNIKPPLPTLAGILRDLVAGSLELPNQTVPMLDIKKLASRVTP